MAPKTDTKPTDRMVMLSRVAEMYYEQQMSQKAIADTLGFSRSAVSRYLNEALELDIVEIHINRPFERNADMETLLKASFGLSDSRILMRGFQSMEQALPQLGIIGANVLDQYLGTDSILGLTWGSSVYHVATAMRSRKLPNVHAVQILGSISPHQAQYDGYEIVRTFSHHLGCSYQTLPTPLLVDSEQIRDALKRDSHIRPAFDMMMELDIALIGISSMDPEYCSLVRAGYVTAEAAKDLAAAGAVAETCGMFFDIDGQMVDNVPLARQVLGIDVETLRRVPLVVAIAAGPTKAAAILGVLRSGLVNILISDDITIEAVFSLWGKGPNGNARE